MAERRMFAKTIVLSDAFLDMPMSARCLYFTLGMLADDDGFVNSPRSIMRQCGASNDDMKILIEKKFVLLFDSGIIVIKHWRLNNYLRSDRYTETKYTSEKAELTADEKGIYHRGIPDGIPAGIPSIGKDRIGKDRIDNTDADFNRFWEAYPRKAGKEAARKAFGKVKVDVGTLLSALEAQKQSDQWTKDGGQFIPYPATWLNQGRWEDDLPVKTPEKQKGRNAPVSNDFSTAGIKPFEFG